MKNNYIIGIDGGGTKTTLSLFDDNGNILDVLQDTGSNLYVYKESGVKIIIKLIDMVIKKHKLNYLDIKAYGIGIAGVSDVFQRESLIKELDRINISSRTLVMSDVEAAYKILCPSNIGILINIGTGIICMARDNENKTYKVAGKGHDKGDVGSGYWLGKELLAKLLLNEALIKYEEELKNIYKIVINEFKEKNLETLYETLEDGKNIYKELSNLGKNVISLAKNGNDIALSIVQEGTSCVSDYIIEIIELIKYNNKNLLLAANGSIIKNSFYRKSLNDSLSFDFKKINWLISDISPSFGAGILAANSKKIDIDVKNIIKNIN